MKNLACVLFALSALAGCVTSPDQEDGRDDTFLGGDGKADTGSVVDGSPDALAVLEVANERSAEEMHDHGVPKRAAENIVAVRVGDDGVAGTSDDVTYATLAQLDAVPYVGPLAFARLLAYANELDGSAASGPGITPPADLWHVAACTPISWSQLVAKFGAGETSFDFRRPYVTATRFRNSCNPVTGCTPWLDNKYAGLWVHDGEGHSSYVVVPSSTRGDLDMDLNPTTTGIGFIATPGNVADDFRFDCGNVAQAVPTNTTWGCTVYGESGGGNANFTNEQFQTTAAEMQGHVCSDGSFHFTTTLLNDDSDSLQNREQVALYGRLF
jgi:hypothetical protein